jgi:hypothetical protein
MKIWPNTYSVSMVSKISEILYTKYESDMNKIWCQSNTNVLEFKHTYSIFKKKKKNSIKKERKGKGTHHPICLLLLPSQDVSLPYSLTGLPPSSWLGHQDLNPKPKPLNRINPKPNLWSPWCRVMVPYPNTQIKYTTHQIDDTYKYSFLVQTVVGHTVSLSATLNQHPPVHHPLDARYYSVMDEPQLS